jgi:hypothetical protein
MVLGVSCLQAQEQLLLELELNVVAAKWRHRRTQQQVLRGWSCAAAAAVQEREQQARLQETFSKVQGWLSDMKGPLNAGGHSSSKHIGSSSRATASAGMGLEESRAAAAGAITAPGGAAVLKQLPPWKDWNPDSDSD